MNAAALPDLPTSEGAQVEFRRSVDAEATARAVAAFLNGDGGIVMVGFEDDGTFVGVEGGPDALTALHREVERSVVPREPLQVTPVEDGGRAGCLIEVAAGAQKPYLVGGTIYVRRGGVTQRATPTEIARAVVRRGDAEERWERQPVGDLSAGPDVLDEPLVHEAYRSALDRLNIPVAPDNRLLTFLDALGLAAEGGPTRAALMLFVRREAAARHLPQARAQVLAFEGDTAEAPLGRREMSGGAAVLAEPLVEAAALELPRVVSLPSDRVRRDDRLAVPYGALREGIINALAHRDYADAGFVSVRLFPDRVEVWNPGSMDRAFLADEGARLVSRPPNPDVARLFNVLGYAEGTGIGLWRIRQAMAEADLPAPTWANQTGGVLLTLRTADGPADDEALTPRLAAFVETVAPGEEITRAAYHGRFAQDVSERTAVNDVQALVEAGYLRQVGSGRFTAYVRTKKAPPSPQ